MCLWDGAVCLNKLKIKRICENKSHFSINKIRWGLDTFS